MFWSGGKQGCTIVIDCYDVLLVRYHEGNRFWNDKFILFYDIFI
jgi:hypothetical protein